MSNPETTPGPNATAPYSDGTNSASQAQQQPAAPLTSFTELLGLDDGIGTGTVCTPDGYCS